MGGYLRLTIKIIIFFHRLSDIPMGAEFGRGIRASFPIGLRRRHDRLSNETAGILGQASRAHQDEDQFRLVLSRQHRRHDPNHLSS